MHCYRIVIPMLIVARVGALRRSWRMFLTVVFVNSTSGAAAFSFPDEVGETGSLGEICVEAMLGEGGTARENRGGKKVPGTATGRGIRRCPAVVLHSSGVGRSV
uniref:Putative secreted protein n=1 Tax=Ixodes ricinus TaxID=34613 RepID=A0A6B0U7S9_IXORI